MHLKKLFALSLLVTFLHFSAFADNDSPCLEGATISTVNNGTAIELSCDDTNVDGMIEVRTNFHSMPFAFVVIDENDIILYVGLQNHIDLNLYEGNLRIYAFSYLGSILAQVGDDLFATELASFCYEFTTNFITVTHEDLEGGSVQLDNGETETLVCVSDGADDILHFNSLAASGGANFTYIITDELGNVLSIPSGDTQNFEDAPQGICQVWGLIYDGNLLALAGDNLQNTNLADGCYGLSNNFITVNRQAVLAGEITFTDNSENFYELCSNSGQSEVNMTVSGNTGDNFAYIVTNIDGGIETIIDASSNYLPQTGFSNTRHIYGIAYSGDAYAATEIQALVTQNINTATLRDDCFSVSEPITLQVSIVDAGGIQLEDGTTVAFICSNDIVNGIITLQNSSEVTALQSYVLTDVDNNIITFFTGNTLNLTIAAAGQYKIWSISYTGDLIAEITDPLMGVALSDGCYDISNNTVSITKTDVDSGIISLDDGTTNRVICPDGNASSLVTFDTEGAAGQSYTYILTDEEGTVIENFDANSFDFASSLASGVIHFWGLAYTGTFTLPFGENVNEAVFSDDCFDLTENFVEVIYEVAYAGIITGEGNINTYSFCAGDGLADVVNFEVSEENHLDYTYLITTADGILLDISTDSSYDFENTSGGDCRVYGLSYSGILAIVPGDDIFDSILSSDCFDVSENFLSISKTAVDGGTLVTSFLENTIYVCAGDGEDDSITFLNNSTATGANYTYVLTTEDDLILVVLDDNTYDFEADITRTYHLWGISYTGNFLAGFGDIITEADLADGCYTFSANFLTIIQDLPEAGEVSTVDGDTDISICIGAESGIVELMTTSNSNSGYAYLLLNADGEILEIQTGTSIDFTSIDTGSYQIQGLSYTGILLAGIGEVAATSTLASSCYVLSDNFIDVIREPAVDGGEISLVNDTATTIYTCPDDGNSDLYIFQSNSTDDDLLYVITDDNNNIIVPQIISPAIDFNAASPGVYRIYGISLNGSSNLAFGVNVLEDELSDRCYAASENFITIVVMTPEGGMVTSDQGENVDITVGDGITDTLTFSHIDASSTPYIYIITDENNEILDFIDGNIRDFEDAPAGICRVWGLAYTGNILAEMGDVLTDVLVTDDCFSLSENFVTLTRSESLIGQRGVNEENNVNFDTTPSLAVSTYPNPARERFTLNINLSNANDSKSAIRIINTNGQIVQQFSVATTNGTHEIEVNVQGLQAGLYVLMVNNAKMKKMVRFIKQ